MGTVEQTLAIAARSEWENGILPFWLTSLKQAPPNKMVTALSADGTAINETNTACLLVGRFLWAMSASARELEHRQSKIAANKAYHFFIHHCLDKQQRGVCWILNNSLHPISDDKQTIAQSMGIYALVEYYRASGSEASLKQAWDLLPTTHCAIAR